MSWFPCCGRASQDDNHQHHLLRTSADTEQHQQPQEAPLNTHQDQLPQPPQLQTSNTLEQPKPMKNEPPSLLSESIQQTKKGVKEEVDKTDAKAASLAQKAEESFGLGKKEEDQDKNKLAGGVIGRDQLEKGSAALQQSAIPSSESQQEQWKSGVPLSEEQRMHNDDEGYGRMIYQKEPSMNPPLPISELPSSQMQLKSDKESTQVQWPSYSGSSSLEGKSSLNEQFAPPSSSSSSALSKPQSQWTDTLQYPVKSSPINLGLNDPGEVQNKLVNQEEQQSKAAVDAMKDDYGKENEQDRQEQQRFYTQPQAFYGSNESAPQLPKAGGGEM